VTPSVAVIGAGISGLGAAHRLRTLLGPGAQVTVFEQSARVGGVLRTVTLAGRPFDVGAEAFLLRRAEVPQLLAELGLGEQLVHTAGAAPSVRAAGRTLGLPAGTMMGIPSTVDSMREVLSAAALARLAAEPERELRWQPGADLSVGELVRERFGPEVVARSVDPLLGGVYSGHADSLGVRAAVPALADALDAGAPSLLAAVAAAVPAAGPGGPVFGALCGGYDQLTSALQATVTVRLSCPVTGIARAERGWWVQTADGRAQVDAMVLAVPAPAVRTLLAPVVPAASRAAAEIALAPTVVVGLAFAAREIEQQLPRTSGMLVATGEPLAAKAFTHSSRKWPHLADGEVLLLRASLGRFGEAVALQVDDAELVARVRADLAAVHGMSAVPLDVVVQRWGGGLPQYGPGHPVRVAAIEHAVDAHPGLAVAGAMLHGVGVPACIGTGRAAAERVVRHLTAGKRHTGVVAP